RRRSERHHRRRSGKHVGRHQRNDDDGREHHDVRKDRKRNRIPLLGPDFDRWIDHVTEHVTRHGSTLPQPTKLQRKTANYSQSQKQVSTNLRELRHHFSVYGPPMTPAGFKFFDPPSGFASRRTNGRRRSPTPGGRPPTGRGS